MVRLFFKGVNILDEVLRFSDGHELVELEVLEHLPAAGDLHETELFAHLIEATDRIGLEFATVVRVQYFEHFIVLFHKAFEGFQIIFFLFARIEDVKGGQVVAVVFSELIFLGVEVVNVLGQELGFGVDSNSLFEHFHGVFFL